MDSLKSSLFVATGAFAGTLLMSKNLNGVNLGMRGYNCEIKSDNWQWQSVFGALGGVTAAWMGMRFTKLLRD